MLYTEAGLIVYFHTANSNQTRHNALNFLSVTKRSIAMPTLYYHFKLIDLTSREFAHD